MRILEKLKENVLTKLHLERLTEAPFTYGVVDFSGRADEHVVAVDTSCVEKPKDEWFFEFYDGINYYEADRVARISLFDVKYLTPVRIFGKNRWILNGYEKEELYNFLLTAKEGSSLTGWQKLIIKFNREYLDDKLPSKETKKNLLSEGRLIYPNHLPFDLPLPDYRKLPDKG